MSDRESKPGPLRRFVRFMAEDKWWWITPIVLVVIAMSIFLVVVEGSTLAPFIYSMF